ncbi:unnamed protein product [Caenorhabditis brenneri]
MPPKIDWENDPGCIELMNFLIERTKDAKSPLNIKQLAREFKEKSGSSLNFLSLVSRIRKLSGKVAELDTIDKKTKVKMMFALSVSIDKDFLNDLRKDADVEVDGKNRITKYRAKDGRLELEGDQSFSAKMRDVLKPKMDSEEDSRDVSRDSIPKTSGSMKRSAPEVPNSSKRTKVKSEESAPDSAGIAPRGPPNPETQLLRQPKLERNPGAEEAPIFRSGGAPRASGAPVPKSEANDVYTPQIKFLEAIQFLILNLDTPTLSPLKTKIDEKLRESSPNAKIANDEMKLAMELLATKITNHSMPILTENVESVSLKVFMCFLQAAILHSKLGGLEALLEKIKERINEPFSKDKNIPIEKVISVLQHTLDGI